MRGQVLEISADDPDAAMRVLVDEQSRGAIAFDEVALYGAQIHIVVSNAEEYRPRILSVLSRQGVSVHDIAWIAPTLEDVFISAVKPQ